MEETQLLCGLKREDFQTTIDGKKTDLYVLRNSQGNEVALTNYGGAVVAIMMPDKEGKHANIIQGHDSIKGVMESPEPYLSTLVGRYANRIARGRFQLHGKEYNLAINNGPNCLHGGKQGFNAKVWDATQVNPHAVVMKYTSPYGEEGFSGEVVVWVAFTLTDADELVIKYRATSLTMVSSPSLASPILPPRSTTSFWRSTPTTICPSTTLPSPRARYARWKARPSTSAR